jgi:hypothetical protein
MILNYIQVETNAPHPVPLPIGWGEGVQRTGEGFVWIVGRILNPNWYER